MAKDGTNRGGLRRGAGTKKKPLAEKILNGKTKDAKVMTGELPAPAELEGADVPPVREYLTAHQKNGSELLAAQIFKETWLWLKQRGCENLVNLQLIEQYAMSVARWIQCEEAISEYGYISKHPTTNAPIASPFVSMSREYKKQVNADWYLIYQVVKDNCSVDYDGLNPNEDLMERLLRKGKQGI